MPHRTTPSQPAVVEARAWGWRHATRRAWALEEVSFRIDPGERVLLLGASGSGKSTLLHGLAGVLGGDDEGEAHGALTIDGVPAAHARGRAGLVLQDPDSQAILARVGDDVAFGAENLGVAREEIWRRVAWALDAVGLDVALDRSTSALSGGQKQRLALAGALAMRPGLLLLDEPTANLDPDGVTEVRDAVARAVAATGATLVVVEHRLDAWLPVVDRVIVLGQGGVVADGTPDEVLGVHGPALAASGVWVPGIRPAWPAAPATGPGEALLTARNLAVGRRRKEAARPRRGSHDRGQAAGAGAVAEGIDLDVRAGEVLGITGPNGAGKTTLGLTLAGLLEPVEGRVTASAPLADGARAREPIRWTSRALLTRIGTVFQDPEHQLLASTVRGELQVGPKALGLAETEIDTRVGELLERLRLDRLAEANPYTLSGGEKRRLTVAAMLATRPRVVVLDEPTFGQDARTWAELVAIIARQRDAGTAVVAVTHDHDVLAALRAREYRLGGAP